MTRLTLIVATFLSALAVAAATATAHGTVTPPPCPPGVQVCVPEWWMDCLRHPDNHSAACNWLRWHWRP